ncbi:hypothetical protein K501DRAFT_257796 [Backusella circina FSU 941]|nr:hypothetical protein K501DRAFT_257796 [Backusella circina FSU 941]
MVGSTLFTLSQRFKTTSPQWFRQFSTSNILRQVENKASESTVMPNVLSAELHTPKELSTSLDPYAGRSIGSVTNANTAYRRLNAIISQNNVRKELRANQYYEKPNVARRRQKIESNRKLFKAMVRKKVALIMQMKQRGM